MAERHDRHEGRHPIDEDRHDDRSECSGCGCPGGRPAARYQQPKESNDGEGGENCREKPRPAEAIPQGV